MNAERNQTQTVSPTDAASATIAGAQPLLDAHGVPLLPRVAARIRAAQLSGETVPPLAPGRVRSVLDAGEAYQGIDPELLADYQQRGRYLHAVASGEALGTFFIALGRGVRAVGRVIGRGLSRLFTPAPSPLEVQRVLGPGYRGVLGLNADYWRDRERYYGRGL